MKNSDKSVFYFLSFLLSVLFFQGKIFAQVPTVQDCLGAIPVCTYQYNQPLSFQGTGNYPNEINATQTCPRSCMDGELNSVWYVISVKTGGLLSFVITPVSSADDYDWAVYNLNSMECSDIYSNAIFMQSSCNAAGGPSFQGPTGISSANGGTHNCNGGGNTFKWNADLPVNAGDTYVLCVSNWTATQSGYLLDFGASTADIFDDIQAVIASVNTDIGCAGATSMSFAFTENVKCFSVQPSDFLLVGPDGSQHVVTSVNGAGCQAGGEQEKFFTVGFYPPIYLDGTYTLQLIGEVTDLCTNSSAPHSFDFEVTLDPLPAVLAGPVDALVPIGGSASFSVETLGDTSFRWQLRPPGATFWQDIDELVPYSGVTTNTLTVNPCTFDLGQYQFRCIVSGDCPPPTQSSAATLFVGDALAASAACIPEEICIGGQSQLNVNAFGGNIQEPYTYSWTSPDGFASTQQNPFVEPLTTTTYTVTVDDGYNPTTAQVTVVVNPLPVADAGTDLEINHGTFTTLTGSASVGEPPFVYQWQPADSLWNPDLQNPVTRKLRGSTLFTLVVTDGNNCVSEPDQMQVNVVGGPLAASPMASPPVICFGDTTQLFALPSGGQYTNYAYSWSINGEEFSTIQDPVINPLTTTTYSLLLTDDFNEINHEVTVTVNPLPVINLIDPEFHIVNGAIQVCVFDTISLDAGNPGSDYLWNNGVTTQTTVLATSGLSFDFQEHWVRVTNSETGCINRDSVQVMFTFIECSYGIDDLNANDLVKLFPNPAGDSFTVSIDGKPGDFLIQVTDLSGRVLLQKNFSKKISGVFNCLIDVEQIASSTCLVKIFSPDVYVVKKIVISH
ncbi:MAG: T9SS type A sorting domain-containing protein [Bacteroidales bacterium]|nr:T9SS type A sorting domain-containing protein [Bacteroidales bacterium]